MGPIAHAVISAPLGVAVWVTTGDVAAGAVTFVAGTLIDADHLVDYISARGLRLDLESIRTGSYFKETGRALVPLHSYEVVILVTLLSALWFGHALAFGIAVGAMVHLACDVAFYRFSPLCYSLAYRVGTSFSLKSFRPISHGAQGGANTR